MLQGPFGTAHAHAFGCGLAHLPGECLPLPSVGWLSSALKTIGKACFPVVFPFASIFFPARLHTALQLLGIQILRDVGAKHQILARTLYNIGVCPNRLAEEEFCRNVLGWG